MEIDDTRELNPWFSIWTRPRDTIRQIVTRDPNRLVVMLAAIAGIASTLDRASTKSLGDNFGIPLIFAIALIIGPISGVLSLYVGAALLRWTGSWIGGSAPAPHIRAAMAWASVPIIWAMLIWIPELALFGGELFTSATPRMDSSATLLAVYLGFTLIELAVAVWAVVVFLKCLGEVQGFSAWKALGNSLLAALVIAVPLALIVAGLTIAT